MRSLVLLLSCLVAACGPSYKVPSPVNLSTPAVAAPVAPAIEIVRQNAQATAAVAQKLETQVATLSRSTAIMADNTDKAMAELTRLRAQKVANEAEIGGVYDLVDTLKEELKAKAQEEAEALKTANAQMTLRIKTDKDMADLAEVGRKRDIQAEQLASNFKDALQSIKELKESVNTLTAAKDKAEKAEAANGVYKLWVYILGGAVFVLVALVIVLRVMASRIPKLPTALTG